MMPIESGARRSTLKKGADISDLFTRRAPAASAPVAEAPVAEPMFVPPAAGLVSSYPATHTTRRPEATAAAPAPEMPAGIRPVVDLDAPAMPSKAPEAKTAPVLISPLDRTAKARSRDIIPAVYSQRTAGGILPASSTSPVRSRVKTKSRIRTADDDGKVWDDSGWK